MRVNGYNAISEYITNRHADQSGIIYCAGKKCCDTLAAHLKGDGVSAAAYHAETPQEERMRIHKEWMEGTMLVVVATVCIIVFTISVIWTQDDTRIGLQHAFGMGIDKPNGELPCAA